MMIVIKINDGSIRIMALLDEAAQAFEHMPELVVNSEIATWAEEEQSKVVSWRVMDDSAIPTDRTFRNAWANTTREAIIDHDMAKCRDIWRDKMRQARAKKLSSLDVEFAKAIATGKPVDGIEARKQLLRDVTSLPEIEAATTPDDLKNIWPDILK